MVVALGPCDAELRISNRVSEPFQEPSEPAKGCLVSDQVYVLRKSVAARVCRYGVSSYQEKTDSQLPALPQYFSEIDQAPSFDLFIISHALTRKLGIGLLLIGGYAVAAYT